MPGQVVKDALPVRARGEQVVATVNKFVGGWFNTTPPTLPAGGLVFTGGGKLTDVGSGSVSLESPTQYAFVSSLGGSHLAGNAWWDGTNWQRYDTAQASAVWVAGAGTISYLTAPAGTGVLAMVSKLTIDVSGNLRAPNVYATGGYLHTTDGGNGVVMSDNGDMYVRGASGKVIMDGASGLTVSAGGTYGNHLMVNQATGGIGDANGSQGQLELQAPSGASKIAFHRVGAYAAYLGIDTDNQWAVGGWSMGAVRYVLITDTQTQTLSNKTIVNMKASGPTAFYVFGNDLTNYTFNAINGGVITLPTPSTAYSGVFRAVKAWTADITVNCATATLIQPGSTGAVVSSFVLKNGDSVTFWCDGTNWWGL